MRTWGETLAPIQRIMSSSLSKQIGHISHVPRNDVSRLTYEIDTMRLHEQMTIPHQGRQVYSSIRVWESDLVVEVMQGK